MNIKEIKELLKSAEVKSITTAINRLADAIVAQNEIADRGIKLTEKYQQRERRNLILENRKDKNNSV